MNENIRFSLVAIIDEFSEEMKKFGFLLGG